MKYQLKRDVPIAGLSYDPLNPRLAPREVNPTDTQENLAEILKTMVPKRIVEKDAEGLLPPEEPMLAVIENGATVIIDGNLQLMRRRLALNRKPENPEPLKYADVAVYPSRADAYPAQAHRNYRRDSYWTSHAIERFLRPVCAHHGGDVMKTAEITGYHADTVAGCLAAADLLNQINPGRKNEPNTALPAVRAALKYPEIKGRLQIELDAGQIPFRCPDADTKAATALIRHLTGFQREDGSKAPPLAIGQQQIAMLAGIYGSDKQYRKLLAETKPDLDLLHKELTGEVTQRDMRRELQELETAARNAIGELKRRNHPALPHPNLPMTAQAQIKVSQDGYLPLLHVSSPEGRIPKRLAKAIQQEIQEERGLQALVTR